MRDINPFGLRMPAELKDVLEKSAEKNRRSLNAEILVRLEQSVEQDGKGCISAEELETILQKTFSEKPVVPQKASDN